MNKLVKFKHLLIVIIATITITITTSLNLSRSYTKDYTTKKNLKVLEHLEKNASKSDSLIMLTVKNNQLFIELKDTLCQKKKKNL